VGFKKGYAWTVIGASGPRVATPASFKVPRLRIFKRARRVVGKLCQSSYTASEVPPVPTRNVNLTKELDRFVARSVKRGRYANASEVMRSALCLLEQNEREFEEKLAALRNAIQEGLDSGDAEPGVFDRLDAYIEELAAGEQECRRTA